MGTGFNNYFGNSLKIRVLEFLIEGRELDYSISDIAEGAGIGRTTLFRIWNDFVELGMVKNTRNIGNAKLYKLNISNPFVRKMVDLFDMSVNRKAISDHAQKSEIFDTLVIEPLNKRKKVVVRN